MSENENVQFEDGTQPEMSFPGQVTGDEADAVVAEAMSGRELARAGVGDDSLTSTPALFEDDQLLHADTLDAYQALLAEAGIVIHQAEDVLGDGFELYSGDDKYQLVGKPMLFVQWVFHVSQKFGPMVAIHALLITGDGPKDFRKIKIIDFSRTSGIRTDLMKYSDDYGKFGGLFVRKGLRVSNYMYKTEDPKTGEVTQTPASTFYLDYTVG